MYHAIVSRRIMYTRSALIELCKKIHTIISFYVEELLLTLAGVDMLFEY